MKKKLCFLIFIIMITLNLTACTKKNELTNINPFEIIKAEKAISDYMNSYMAGDFTSMNYMYSKSFKNKVKSQENPQLKVIGYKIMDSTELGKSANIRVNVVSSDLSSPYTSADVYVFKVKKEKSDYVIDNIDTSSLREVYRYKRSLLVKIEDESMSNVLVNLRGIPEYAFQGNDVAKVDKLKVAKDDFNSMSLSYTGDNIALSTVGANPMVVVCGITDLQKQSQGAQGAGGGSDGGGSGSANPAQSQNGGQDTSDLEPLKVAAKAITPVDVYKDSKIEKIIFSRDEKLVAVQYNHFNSSFIKIYGLEAGKMVSDKIEEKFPKDKVNLRIIMFDDENLIFESSPKSQGGSSNNTQRDILGRWQWSIKKGEVKKQNT